MANALASVAARLGLSEPPLHCTAELRLELTSITSLVSMSSKLKVPLVSRSWADASMASVKLTSVMPLMMVGVSLLPLMVMVIG